MRESDASSCYTLFCTLLDVIAKIKLQPFKCHFLIRHFITDRLQLTHKLGSDSEGDVLRSADEKVGEDVKSRHVVQRRASPLTSNSEGGGNVLEASAVPTVDPEVKLRVRHDLLQLDVLSRCVEVMFVPRFCWALRVACQTVASNLDQNGYNLDGKLPTALRTAARLVTTYQKCPVIQNKTFQ